MSSPTNKTVYINFYDSINDQKVKGIMAALAQVVNEQHPDTIYLLFSSSGGFVESGIVLYNFLRALPVKLIMHNTGSIDSIANVIFLAADTRYAAKHSSFLYHGVFWNFGTNTSSTRSQISEILSGIDASETKTSGIIVERTKLNLEEVKALFAQGETKDSQYALAKGVIQEIREPQIPKDAQVLSFNLQ